MKRTVKVSLVATLCAALLLAAGCGGAPSQPANQGGSNPPAQSGSQTQSSGGEASSEKQVEIFSWWTGAGEAAGLEGLIKLFTEKHPDIEVINAAVAGGAGTNAKAVLASRMSGGNPPDTFQVHAGHELLDTWVAADKMEPLNFLYESEGWNNVFPKQLIDMMSKDGNVYSVAVNIHRGNVMWYNTKVFADNNLTPPTTFDEFFTVAEALKAKGITPLALGDKEPWTALHLFESVLLGVLGPDKYNGLFDGSVPWDDPGVRQALETFKRMLQYVNDDHAARNWQDASQLVAQGKAAMNVMGDWAKGYFTTDLNLKGNVDFGWAPSWNTEGTFMVVSDTFGLPKGIQHRDATIEFLKVLGSKEGQDVFNPLKGSIPARTDADVSKYDEYSKEAMQDWSTNKLTPSIAHGSAASPGFSEKITQVITVFVTTGDVDQAVADLVAAASAELK
ncbi:ABC transporter substrate-binding protein [Symbiobacterium terraclitae]|uniref:ABC transporter substrate-binding protein n=1 Tax=Symbiobacterium terraclitae TaxID=557451 RepID=UPI0035B530A2